MVAGQMGDYIMKRMPYFFLAAILCMFVITACGAAKQKEETESQSTSVIFSYVHDPRENPEAMADIIENVDAVYGFSPDPDSDRLGTYAKYDWTNPEFVAQAQEDRRAYHESMDSMTDILYRMRDEGASIEEMARAVSEERNRLRLESYKDDPKKLADVKESNLMGRKRDRLRTSFLINMVPGPKSCKKPSAPIWGWMPAAGCMTSIMSFTSSSAM